MTLEDDEGVDWVGGASQRERVASGAEDDQHAAAWHRQYGARKWGDVNPLRAAKEQADAKAREEAEARRVNRGAKWEKEAADLAWRANGEHARAANDAVNSGTVGSLRGDKFNVSAAAAAAADHLPRVMNELLVRLAHPHNCSVLLPCCAMLLCLVSCLTGWIRCAHYGFLAPRAGRSGTRRY